MKKTVAVLLCVCLMVCLSACESGVFCEHTYTSSVTKEPTYEAEGETTYVCSKCGHTYTEPIAKLEKHVVPTSILDKALSNSQYSSGMFSMSVGELVNSAVKNYKIEYLTGEEAIQKGYLNKNDIDDSVDIDYLYYAIVSGECMLNMDIPYMTEYEEEAVKVWLIFDENDKLLNSGASLCQNLRGCAMQIMASSY
mgnify:CR=1 FL=1